MVLSCCGSVPLRVDVFPVSSVPVAQSFELEVSSVSSVSVAQSLELDVSQVSSVPVAQSPERPPWVKFSRVQISGMHY